MKKAFTMLELVFVIVGIGIISATVLPSTKTNPLAEAATQLVSHIRYTQHLAMVDDKFNSSDNEWYKKRWQLIFQPVKDSGGEIAYSIFSDNNLSSNYDGKPTVSDNEIAEHILDKSKYMSGGTHSLINTSKKVDKKMNLTYSYGIESYEIKGNNCNNSTRIVFDYLGRPIYKTLTSYNQSYKNNRLIEGECNITLKSSEGSITITINSETGYSYIR